MNHRLLAPICLACTLNHSKSPARVWESRRQSRHNPNPRHGKFQRTDMESSDAQSDIQWFLQVSPPHPQIIGAGRITAGTYRNNPLVHSSSPAFYFLGSLSCFTTCPSPAKGQFLSSRISFSRSTFGTLS